MKIVILLSTCLVLLDSTSAMNTRGTPAGTTSPIPSFTGEILSRRSTEVNSLRENLQRESPLIANAVDGMSPRESRMRAGPSRGGLPREDSPEPQPLPTRFPPNTRVFVQNRQGKVFSGLLSYLYGRTVPRWVDHSNGITTEAESVHVRMPNGDGLISVIRELTNNVSSDDEVHAWPRCFISYGDGRILEAILKPYSQWSQDIPREPRGFVRMPGEHHRFFGQFQQFRGERPSWIE